MISALQICVQLWLLSLALAAPGSGQSSPCKRGACNADNCLRAIRATVSPILTASSDCASFMRKTVIPCAATVTATATGTVTAAPSTLTVTQLTQVTSEETQIVPLTSTVTTIEDVFGLTATSVVPVYQTATITVQPRGLDNRQAGTNSSCAIVVGGTSIPTYASACSGAVRYSSACSCYGVTATTVIASQPTSTVTASSIVTVTPTITVTAQQTQVSVHTNVQTSIVPETLEATFTSVVATAFATQVSQATVTQTATSICSTFAPYATNGAFAGHALSLDSSTHNLVFSPSMSNPQLLVVQTTDSTVTRPGGFFDYFSSKFGTVLFDNPYNRDGSSPLICHVGDPLNQSGIFPLLCARGVFQTCGTDPTLKRAYSTVDSGCEIADLGVFFAC